MISSGPPKQVANMGRPVLMASITVRPNASNRAGCTNAPRRSAMHAVKLAGQPLLQVLAQPAHLAVEGVLVHEAVHGLDLLALLVVGTAVRVHVARDHQQVGGVAQGVVVRVPRHQAGDVLDAVHAGHGEQDRLVGIGQDAAHVVGGALAEDHGLDLLVQVRQTAGLVGGREVHGRVGARRDDVELGIEHVDAVHHAVEAGHGERFVGLVLADGVGRCRRSPGRWRR